MRNADDASSRPELLTAGEVAEWLRTTVATLATWRCTKKVKIPYVKIGDLVRYKWADVEEYLNSNYMN